jgi:hypothetical protein
VHTWTGKKQEDIYYKFYRNYPTFWIDLWTIVQKKNPALIEWYLPEVAEGDTQVTQEEEEESDVK